MIRSVSLKVDPWIRLDLDYHVKLILEKIEKSAANGYDIKYIKQETPGGMIYVRTTKKDTETDDISFQKQLNDALDMCRAYASDYFFETEKRIYRSWMINIEYIANDKTVYATIKNKRFEACMIPDHIGKILIKLIDDKKYHLWE